MRDIVVHVLYIVTCTYTWLVLDTSVVDFVVSKYVYMCFTKTCEMRTVHCFR